MSLGPYQVIWVGLNMGELRNMSILYNSDRGDTWHFVYLAFQSLVRAF